MRTLRASILAGVLITTGLWAVEIGAQTPPRPSTLAGVVATLDSASVLRIGLGQDRVDGMFRTATGSNLRITTDTGEVELIATQIDSLWIQASRKRTGAWIGMGAGLALTALSCAETFDECGLDAGLLVITPALTLLGAGIGSTIWNWRLLFP